jgi:hypothetical protein
MTFPPTAVKLAGFAAYTNPKKLSVGFPSLRPPPGVALLDGTKEANRPSQDVDRRSGKETLPKTN